MHPSDKISLGKRLSALNDVMLSMGAVVIRRE
jgi:hypothetical protein